MASLYKRGKTWWGRVQRQGKEWRQSLKTTDKGVAEKRLREWIGQMDSVAWGDKPRVLFEDAVDAFVAEHLSTLKPAGARRYLSSLAALAGTFEGMYLDEITTASLTAFETSRRREGRRIPEAQIGRRKPAAISASTILRDLACLSSLFSFAQEREWCVGEGNPVPAFKKTRKRRGLKEGNAKTRWLRHEEEARLLGMVLEMEQRSESERMRKHYRNLHDAICLAIDTGLRGEELFSLRRDQIRNGRIVLTTGTKNSKAREVPLLDRSKAILNRPVEIVKLPGQEPFASPYVLTNPKTGTRYKSMLKGLKENLKRAGLDGAIWHDLRRTCGCRLLQDHHMSIERVSKWLGHSDIAVTQKSYAFLETEDLEKGIRRKDAV